jgi:membrane associated rhomboid family serine protease
VFLLPLSREGGGPRRVPWLTIAIVVANTIALVVLVAATDESAVERRVGDLVGFVRSHPYLELSPAAADLLSERTLDRLATARERSLAADLPPMEEFDEARRALDAQEAAVFAAIRDLPSHRWGFVPRDPWSISLLTSFFLHAGWMHLCGNMLFLWITAPFVEDRLGRPGFAAFYLAAGLAGNAAHWMRYPGADIPLVGASGAVAGMMGAFVVFFARSRIRFLVLPLPIVVALPVLLVMPLWLAEQMWLSRYSDGSNVAFGAHVGGFVFGLAVAAALRLTRPEEPVLARAPAREQDGDREALEDAIASGEVRAIETAGGRLLDRLRQAGDGAAAELALDLRARLGPPLPLRLWTSCASALERHHPEAALAMYDEVVRAAPAEAAALRAHLRRGELYKRLGRAADARRALEQALAHAACTAGMRDTVERSLAGLGVPPR